MQLSDFDYNLPKALIAQYPMAERSASKLLIKKLDHKIIHAYFNNIIDYFKPGDLLVLNNSKVIPARLFGAKKTGGKVEIMLERITGSWQAIAQIKSNKTIKNNTEIIINDKLRVLMTARVGDMFSLEFIPQADTTLLELLHQYGHMPLPPYISRDDEELDLKRYQTVFAVESGSVAAPTAGLHFDEILINKLTDKGIDIAYITLHVGAGTYQPVRVDNIKQHKMHSEYINVSEETCDKINKAQNNNKNIIAVGTTAARALETSKGRPYVGETDIFIYPG